MAEELKIGSTLWTIDRRDRRDGWKCQAITGETKQSWLVGSESSFPPPRKVNKKTMLENLGTQWGHQRWYSNVQKDAQVFIDNHRRHIERLVGVEQDADKLKQIAEILGMELTCTAQS